VSLSAARRQSGRPSLADKFGAILQPSREFVKPGEGLSNRLRRAPGDTRELSTSQFCLLLVVFIWASFPTVLSGSATFNFRDYGMFSYPVAHFQRQSFWHGEWPLWNPFNYCGIPFLAQWNTMSLYPLSILYLALPMPWSLSFFCLAHLFWGGLGMFLLARQWTGRSWGAAFAGVVFAFNGLSLNLLMWPSHTATFSWMPWVLWTGQLAWRQGGRKLFWAALAASMQMLAGGPETIVFSWVILCLLACADFLALTANKNTCCSGGRRRLVMRLSLLGGSVALISSAQLLPFLELLAHSRNSGYSGASTHNWAMPFWGWANFLLPLFRALPLAQGVYFPNSQYWTSSYYIGIGTVLLAVIGLWRMHEARVRLLGGLCLLALVLAWGNASPLFGLLRTCFPPLGMARDPVKLIIIVVALAPLLAAFGFQSLSQYTGRLGPFGWGCAAALMVLLGALLAVDWNAFVLPEVHEAVSQSASLRALFFLALLPLLAVFRKWSGRPQMVLGVLVLACTWLDLATQAPWQNPTVPPQVYAPRVFPNQGQPHSSTLAAYRAMVAPGARQQLSLSPLPNLADNYLRNRSALRPNCNLLDGVAVVDGFFSLVPRENSRITALLYPAAGEAPNALLDVAGVALTTAPESLGGCLPRSRAMPLATIGQQPVFTDDQSAFQALTETGTDLRRVVILPPTAHNSITATRQLNATVSKVNFANQSLALQTDAPETSMVVIAQSYYPAWKAYIDGHPVKLWRANYAFQALQVLRGQHRVELRYEDRAFRTGLILSALGLICLVLFWLELPRPTLALSKT
jgi:hypothetical protein